MYEAYFAGDLDFKGDVLETLRNHRREFLCVPPSPRNSHARLPL